LVVKVHEQGNMSKHLDELSIGDTILCKGPIKRLPYEANMKKKLCMIAGADLRFLSYSFFQLLFPLSCSHAFSSMPMSCQLAPV
jgi:hypothetical protein